ncbi:hypothetical protein M2418_002672 [Rhizobium sp. BIGb0125]|uniref:hypothetical protein n=1 Tax=Rhizobium sp. BIGb0125 TaxID=2940618 RepID=UPI0021695260|nr:hypothetical protein [Rhizobium sp. BIGb0125]MCS4243141.1 hypothetical protein [Rhizobium sp. BIGb0125]
MRKALLAACALIALFPVDYAQSNELSRAISPWGVKDLKGVDPFGETLISTDDRGKLQSYLYQQTLLEGVAAAQSSQDVLKGMGYAVKGLGYAAGTFGGGDTGGLGDGQMAKTMAAMQLGPAALASAIAGGYVGDLGDAIIENANEVATARVASYLQEEYGNIIRPNGKLNFERLREIGDTELGKAIRDPKFREQVGNLDILNDLKTTAVIDMLQVGLQDTKLLKEGVGKLDEKLVALNKGYLEVKSLQKAALERLDNHGAIISKVQRTTDSTKLLLSSLVNSNMPPQQILALWNAGALQISDDAIEGVRRRASASDLKKDFDSASSAFKSAATVFQTLGMSELADATNKTSSLLAAGGAFAAACTIGEPLSIFNTGAALFGSMGSMFGGGGRSDGNAKLLQAVFRELRQLSEVIQANHVREMEALRQIAIKLVDVEATINRKFAELGLDVAYLQRDSRELLYEDVRVCERLVEEAQLPETRKLWTRGLIGFAIWFESDNRPLDYARCLNGLSARQRVSSETEYSGMLRADNLEEGSGGVNVAARRDSVRRFSQRVLQPTVEYVREMREDERPEVAAGLLYNPALSLCDIYVRYATEAGLVPNCQKVPLPPIVSRIKASEYNAGQGAWLSTPTVVLLSKFTRTVAPWNGVLIERTTGAASRTISEAEALKITKLSASRRTRHVRALSDSVDAIDLTLGQAQIIAGLPAVPKAVSILKTKVIPAFHKARRLNEPDELNKLLAAPDPSASLPGPVCATGNDVWDTLCMMQTNPTFATNVIRALVAEQVSASNISFDLWRSAIRSPFSNRIQEVLGSNVVLFDAVPEKPQTTLGLWAIELPRVHSDPNYPKAPSGSVSCWTNVAPPSLYKTGGTEVDTSVPYYTTQSSGRCYLLDPHTSENFEVAAFATDYHSLLTERLLAAGVLKSLCDSNTLYPQMYCHQVQEPTTKPDAPSVPQRLTSR